LVYQKECVTVSLYTSLQAIGAGHRSVSTAWPVTQEKDSLAFLRAKDEPGFHNIRKNKNGDCFRFGSGSRRILRHELL